MAAATTINGIPSKSSQAVFLFLGLLFMILLLLVRPADQLRMSMATSFSTEKLSLELSWSTPQSTVKAHPQQTEKTHTYSSSTSTGRKFEASAHEVPSGPNPISNR
ncbi:PREDICTED: CLAVATA3/ESR (CLE)-related protein 44 [Nelumbo nucifera]|uniref:CLAVATA3/ESR (CLE)-related protein 44 n=2 Tax=Nelumbo nucifera TaxID=4432 RepID=A0A822Z0J6_NELNU|nr:PREDICTED: CLAVATA3/ESR (CLE)-related protein 44 [Nelumbo nucifera]DAD37005.1 TPA_asm: hypothetical protein HUJ06_007646 [Nelumbo nucifera]